MTSILSTPRGGMRRASIAAALSAAALAAFAAGCASPDWQGISAGTGSDELRSRLGAPNEVYRLPDGSTRWFYAAPGQAKWLAEFDANGRVVGVRQALSGEAFGEARIGQWTTQDVLHSFGKPAETAYFPRLRRSVWSYRFLENGVWYATMHFYFDPDGVLRLTQSMPDFESA